MFRIQRFKKFYQLQDHLNERIRTPIYSVLRSNLITFFKTILSLEEFDEITILRTAAILDTNAFEIRSSDGCSKLRAIYPETAMMSHDCVPNSYHTFDENMQIAIRAASKLLSLSFRHFISFFFHFFRLHRSKSFPMFIKKTHSS